MALVVVFVAAVWFGVSAFFAGPTKRKIVFSGELASAPNTEGPAAQPTVRYEDGTTVQLLGMRDWPDGKQWWGADGSTVEAPKGAGIRVVTFKAENARVLDCRFKADGPKSRWRDFETKFTGEIERRESWPVGAGNIRDAACVVALPKDAGEIEIKVGVATGPWETKLEKGAGDAPTPPAEKAPVRIGEITEARGRTRIALLDDRAWNEKGVYKLVVVTGDGKTLGHTGMQNLNGQQTYEFNVSRSDVAKVQYQIRVLDWRPIARLKLP